MPPRLVSSDTDILAVTHGGERETKLGGPRTLTLPPIL